ncbi:MAG: site-2 protease family protein [Clostridiales bacterium]|nr:site-2 protease family protein [Clostridiales bacterium]
MFFIIGNLSAQGHSFANILAFVLGYIFAVVLAFGLHEYSHAFVANKLGDPTPKALGRLTLNPFKHLDKFGMLGFLIFGFGWAKPVPINPMRFKRYKRDMVLVSLSGVITNLILAFIISGIYFFYFTNVAKFDANGFTYSNSLLYMIHYFLQYSIILNIALFVFNLLPIYPLDGFNTIKSMLKPNNKFVNFMYRYGNIILLILLITPLFDMFYNLVTGFLTNTFFSFWGLFA